jgi:hypothetical protein
MKEFDPNTYDFGIKMDTDAITTLRSKL